MLREEVEGATKAEALAKDARITVAEIFILLLLNLCILEFVCAVTFLEDSTYEYKSGSAKKLFSKREFDKMMCCANKSCS